MLFGATPDPTAIRIRRWPTERPLLLLNVIVAGGLWIVFFVAAQQMLTWVCSFMALFGMMHLGLVAQIRGSAVRLGPDQFPKLHAHVENLARRMGLRRMPEVYLVQQDGAINAFATRFLRTHMVVLFADLLEACGDNDAARDMIIGHELGHIRSGHLWGHWLLMPASLIPFVGGALSRAREYTCDRYGRAAAGDEDAALVGLTILAAGGRYAPQVNRVALARQQQQIAKGWMMVGEWLATHPPLSKRLIALAPHLAPAPVQDRIRWVRPIFAAIVVFLIGGISMGAWLPSLRGQGRGLRPSVEPAAAAAQVRNDLERLRLLIESDTRAGRQVPWDVWELYARWSEVHGKDAPPTDPFSGYWYDYDQRGGAYRLWSTGPDGENRTKDDIVIDSRVSRQPRGSKPARRAPTQPAAAPVRTETDLD
jgi:Zn-dependent protease with chaperone function